VPLSHGREGGAVAAHAVNAYAQGYSYAMLFGAGLALIGAVISLTRGAHEPTPGAPAHGRAAQRRPAPRTPVCGARGMAKSLVEGQVSDLPSVGAAAPASGA
jgi:hypothetical protein